MEKYIILRDKNKIIDGLLLVKNWDEEFASVFNELVREWMKTDDEFSRFVWNGLRECGYDFTDLECEIVDS